MSRTKASSHHLPFSRAARKTLIYRFFKGRPLGRAEIDHLQALNRRLYEIEALCLNEARLMAEVFQARMDDPEDAITDFEIEVTVTAYLREGDPAWNDDADNILATREYPLTRGESLFCDGCDWSFEIDSRIQGIGPVGWMFHDFHRHNHQSNWHPGKEWRELPVRDLLRIGHFWVDINAIHQWNLAIPPQ